MATEVGTSPALYGGYRFGGNMTLQTGFEYSAFSSPFQRATLQTPSNHCRIYTRIALSITYYRGEADTPDSFPYVQSGGAQTPTGQVSLLDSNDNFLVYYSSAQVVGGDDMVLLDRKTPLVVPEFYKLQVSCNAVFVLHYTFQMLY